MIGRGNEVLVINPGSATVKFRIYSNDKIILDGVIDGIGKVSDIDVDFLGACMKGTKKINNYKDAANFILDFIEDALKGVKIRKVAYRVVHGGSFKDHVVITKSVLRTLKQISKLAPLHMPQAIDMIKVLMKKLKAKHIACFDTAFHRTMPDLARIYALQLKITKKYNIQRYGFHGLAHQYMLEKANEYFGKGFSKIITCQLGNGTSITAVKNRKSIDTSMGFTPLEGVVMGTRSGSIDPSIVAYLSKKEGISADRVIEILNNESGLRGISGESDVRKLLKRKDKQARLALDLFAYSVKKYIGAYIAALGGVDVIMLGGGISRSPLIIQKILSGLEELGIVIDKNKIKEKAPACISKGRVKVCVLETDEQKIMYGISRRF